MPNTPALPSKDVFGVVAVCDPGAKQLCPAFHLRGSVWHTCARALCRCPAGNTLRQLVYDVVCDGSLLPPATPQGRPSHTRQALGSLASFAASGLVHEGIFW